MDKLHEAYAKLCDAKMEVKRNLERIFPEGTKVAFMIKAGQKQPSTGVVISCRYDGNLNVKHDQAKKFSRYSHRDIFYTRVVKI